MTGNLSNCWTVTLLIVGYCVASAFQMVSAAPGYDSFQEESAIADAEPAFALEKIATAEFVCQAVSPAYTL